MYNPLHRSFKSVVRITALVLKAVRLFKIKRVLGLIRDGKADKKVLEEYDVPPVKFTVFTATSEDQLKSEDRNTKYFMLNCTRL